VFICENKIIMEKRALLAIVLSLLVIITYQAYIARNYPQTAPVEPANVISQPSTAIERPAPRIPLEQIEIPDEKEAIVETERFIITFTNVGGCIKKIELKDYPDSKTNLPYQLAVIEDPIYGIGNIKDFYLAANADRAEYNMAKSTNSIIYSYSNNNVSIEKIYRLHNSLNHIELEIRIKNLTSKDLSSQYSLIGGTGINKSGAFAARYIEASSKVNGKIFRDRRESSHQGELSWIALKSKYFAILLKPYIFGLGSSTRQIGSGDISVNMKTGVFNLSTGSELSHQYLYYIGPFSIPMLKQYGMGLEEIVDYGVFGGISTLLLNLLRFFNKIFHNWGVSILCLTVLINLILSPLSIKSYKSMKQIQQLQPHIEKLRELHKDNPTKLQKEMMELYRTYKVNPLGGCLPMLLQMPIVIAMYQGMMRAIELKGAAFLWIKDLSAPDAVPLPFTLPLFGDSINILPLIMIGAMIAQQKLSPMSRGSAQSEQQKQQQAMMLFMPLIFGLLFYSMPSGLVLYWLLNTVLMMFNQFRIMHATDR